MSLLAFLGLKAGKDTSVVERSSHCDLHPAFFSQKFHDACSLFFPHIFAFIQQSKDTNTSIHYINFETKGLPKITNLINASFTFRN